MFTDHQLEALGYNVVTIEGLLDQLIPLFEHGVHYIGIYLKEKGAIMLAKNKYCLVETSYMPTTPHNTAASGAFLGAFAIGINRKYELERFSKLCLAAALAAHSNVNQQICTRKDVEVRLKKTKIRQLTR